MAQESVNPAELDDYIDPGTARDLISLTPSSVEAAKEEIKELRTAILEIEGQLIARNPDGLLPDDEWVEHRRWRRKASSAKNWKVQRLNFLRSWLHNQVGHARIEKLAVKQAAADKIADIPLTAVLRSAAVRVGQFEAVYRATVAFVDEETDETRSELMRVVENARNALKPSAHDEE